MALVTQIHQHKQDDLLPFSATRALADQFHIQLREVEETALAHNIWPERYHRHKDIFSPAQQRQLLGATVAIIGCGGLGGHVFEQLLRLGIGHLIVVDPDTFAPHNLNRQLLCTIDELGKSKVEAAQRRAAQINPATRVSPVAHKFSTELHPQLCHARVIIDCLDSIADRHHLAEYCHSTAIPLVHAAVEKWFGQIGVQQHHPLIQELYPQIPVHDKIKTPSVLACTVAAVASMQVGEAVKILIKLPSPLTDSWHSIDLLNNEIELFNKDR